MLTGSFVTSRHWTSRLMTALLAASVAIVLTASPALADVSYINAKRAGAGLGPVSDSGGLASLARSHSSQMANDNRLFHTGDLGGAVSSVLPNWQGVGENVGVGASLADVNAMFMNSSPHRANILGNFNVAGVGVVTGPDGRVWVTQMFARVPGGGGTTVSTAPKTTTATATTTVTRTTTAPRASRSATGTRTQLRPAPAPPVSEGEVVVGPPAVGAVAGKFGGYQLMTADGGVITNGDAPFAGSAAELQTDERIVGGSATPTGHGYVLFGERGGVFTFGDAEYVGSGAEAPLNAAVVGGAVSPTGKGYTLFAQDGGTLTFGDAEYVGSAAGPQPLNGPVVGGARTPSGRGYWLVGSDGGVYAFGDAVFLGSAAELGALAAPIAGMAATVTGRGYWLVGSDGGVFAFGDAMFHGSSADQPMPSSVPVKGLVPAPTGKGYWLVREDREVVPFGIVDGPILRPPAVSTTRML
jgi:hypothetical protein